MSRTTSSSIGAWPLPTWPPAPVWPDPLAETVVPRVVVGNTAVSVRFPAGAAGLWPMHRTRGAFTRPYFLAVFMLVMFDPQTKNRHWLKTRVVPPTVIVRLKPSGGPPGMEIPSWGVSMMFWGGMRRMLFAPIGWVLPSVSVTTIDGS